METLDFISLLPRAIFDYRQEQTAGPQLRRTQTSPMKAMNRVTAQFLLLCDIWGYFYARSEKNSTAQRHFLRINGPVITVWSRALSFSDVFVKWLHLFIFQQLIYLFHWFPSFLNYERKKVADAPAWHSLTQQCRLAHLNSNNNNNNKQYSSTITRMAPTRPTPNDVLTY